MCIDLLIAHLLQKNAHFLQFGWFDFAHQLATFAFGVAKLEKKQK